MKLKIVGLIVCGALIQSCGGAKTCSEEQMQDIANLAVSGLGLQAKANAAELEIKTGNNKEKAIQTMQSLISEAETILNNFTSKNGEKGSCKIPNSNEVATWDATEARSQINAAKTLISAAQSQTTSPQSTETTSSSSSTPVADSASESRASVTTSDQDTGKVTGSNVTPEGAEALQRHLEEEIDKALEEAVPCDEDEEKSDDLPKQPK